MVNPIPPLAEIRIETRPRLSPISGMEAGTLPKKRREEEMYYVLRSI